VARFWRFFDYPNPFIYDTYKKRLNPFHIIYKKVEKIMVTKYSTKKHDLEHYALSDEIDVFFIFLPPVFKNGQK
jgi:hypothetical protein